MRTKLGKLLERNIIQRAVSKIPCCSILTNKLICVNQQLDGSFNYLIAKGTLLSWQSIPPSFRETAA